MSAAVPLPLPSGDADRDPGGAPTVWTYAAYGLAATLVIGVASCMWAVPLPLSDNLVLILEAQRMRLVDGLRTAFMDRGVLRPFYWAQYKVLFDLSGGHYYLAYQGFHVAMFAATVFLSVSVLRVRTALEFIAAGCSVMVLLGIHTFGNLVREQPILVVTCCALATALAFASRPAWWRDVLAVAALVVAMFIVEIGLLVWVIYVAAWLCGQRGVSRAGLVLATAALAGYFVLRLLVLPSGVPSLFPRDTGFGLAILDTDQLSQRFGDRFLLLYAYNVLASVASVLFAGPRAGVFQFVNRLIHGGLRPWMWINIVSSSVTTLGVAWFLWRGRASLRRLAPSRSQAIVVVAGAVIAANAVISYPYSRDVTMGTAGLAYALAVFPVVVALLVRLESLPRGRRLALAALLFALSSAWAVRVMSLTYTLRVTAFVNRNDWAGAEEWLRRVGRMPTNAEGLALVQTLKTEAISSPVPNPVVAQQYAEAYLGTGSY